MPPADMIQRVGPPPTMPCWRGGADDQGLALAAAMVYNRLDSSCQVIEGSLDGVPHFWNVIQLPESQYHLDLSQYGEHGFSCCPALRWSKADISGTPEDILPR